jgi:hypothetical protein
MARTTFSGPVLSTNGFIGGTAPESRVSINATGVASATALATTRYITSTSLAGTTITLPLAVTAGGAPTVIGMVNALNAKAGDSFDFIVDNTGGANNVIVAVGVGGTLSDAAQIAGSAVAFGRLTVQAGVRGMAKFTLMFTGGLVAATVARPQPPLSQPGTATGYTITRTA